MTAVRLRPIGIHLQQRVIETGQLASGLDVDRVFVRRLIAVFACCGQKKGEFGAEIGEGAMQRFAGFWMMGGGRLAVRGDQDRRLGAGAALARLERVERGGYQPRHGRSIMKFPVEQHAMRLVGFIGRPGPQFGDCGLCVVGGVGEGIAEFGGIERGLGEGLKGVGNFGWVHDSARVFAIASRRMKTATPQGGVVDNHDAAMRICGDAPGGEPILPRGTLTMLARSNEMPTWYA